MMRVASFILPVSDNAGASLRDVHAALSMTAIDVFGGFTSCATQGGWKDTATGKLYIEAGIRYDFAMEDTADNRDKLESFAKFYGVLADQIAVMVTHAGGDVAFIACRFAATVDA